jgi:hypothetical protein
LINQKLAVSLIDPTGLDDAEASTGQNQKKQVVKPMEDKVINRRLDEMRQNAKPPAAGETPTPTTVEVIQGEETILQNATIDVPEPNQDIEEFFGCVKTVKGGKTQELQGEVAAFWESGEWRFSQVLFDKDRCSR